jgi:hypothetical protein
MNLSAANHFGGLAKAPGIAAKRSTRLSTSQAAAFDKACEVLNTMPEIVDELLSFFERDHDASRVLETADVRKLRTFRRPDKRMSELLDKLRYSKVNGYDDLIRCLHSVVVMHSDFSTKDLRLGLQYGHGSPLEHVVENTRGRHLLMEFHKVAHSQRAALATLTWDTIRRRWAGAAGRTSRRGRARRTPSLRTRANGGERATTASGTGSSHRVRSVTYSN